MLRILRNIIRRFLRPIYIVLRNTIRFYTEDKVQRMGAALAYYTIFSLPAILIIIIGLVGFFLGDAAVEGRVYDWIVDLVGQGAAEQIEIAVQNIGTSNTNWWATIIGIGVLIFIATNIFYALQATLNIIFGVQEVPRKVKFLQMIINRVLSFGMILSIGALLIVSILLNGLTLAISRYIQTHQEWATEQLPESWGPLVDYFTDNFLVFLNLGLSIFLIALFFMLMYKILPAVNLRWRQIWAGSIFAAILFWLGQLLIGYYLSNAGMISAYGAAGSLIVLLIWVYYSSQLIFIGAEFIKALSQYRGIIIRPKGFARQLQRNRKNWVRKSRKKDSDGNIIEFYETALEPVD
jgi:membrane protein